MKRLLIAALLVVAAAASASAQTTKTSVDAGSAPRRSGTLSSITRVVAFTITGGV